MDHHPHSKPCLTFLMMLCLGGLCSCSDTEDSVPNRAPQIREDFTLPPPGPLTLSNGSKTNFTLTVLDEGKDVIHYRLFLDGRYDRFLPTSTSRTAGGTVNQVAMFYIEGLCGAIIQADGVKHALQVIVSDRKFVDIKTGASLKATEGLIDTTMWMVTCRSSPTADGGV